MRTFLLNCNEPTRSGARTWREAHETDLDPTHLAIPFTQMRENTIPDEAITAAIAAARDLGTAPMRDNMRDNMRRVIAAALMYWPPAPYDRAHG